MQTILVVSSAQQLDRCLPHVVGLCSQIESPLELWLLADKKSSFAAYAEKKTCELPDTKIRCKTSKPEELLPQLALWRHADWLILPYADEQKELFLSLFEQSPCRTILLDPGIDSDGRPARIISGIEDSYRSIKRVIRQFYTNAKHVQLSEELDFLLTTDKSKRRERLSAALDDHDLESDDLMISTVERDTSISDDFLVAKHLLDLELPSTVMIVRHRMGLLEHGWSKVENVIARHAPPLERDARLALSDDLTENSVLQFEFVALMCAATCLASFGLVQDSAAVIIGAMLVAPLMSPIMGAGLALAYGNRPLFRRSLTTILVGFLCALGTSALFGLLVRITQGTNLTGEMWARSSPSWLDFLVGFVGGLAAAYARSRVHLSNALAGAAIAAALVPPIATAGLQLAFLPIENPRPGTFPVLGPILLFSANVLTIMVATWIVLWLSGIRGDHRFGSKERWANRAVALTMFLIVGIAVLIVEATVLWPFGK